MAQSEYVFQRVEDQRELERLRLIERVFDPASRRRLLATGLQAGWRCLEVGPGAGSIMTWMSELVGLTGQVVRWISIRSFSVNRGNRMWRSCEPISGPHSYQNNRSIWSMPDMC